VGRKRNSSLTRRAIRPDVVTEPTPFSGLTPRMSFADTKFVPEEKHWSAELQRKLCDATLDVVTDFPHGLDVLAGGIL
jgi:hypothetical protein